MSSSSSRAVSMMIGTGLEARSRLQTSSPSSFGSITSSTTRSTCSRSNRSSASSPSRACSTRKPSRSSGIGEELLNRVLVVDEQDGRGIWHRQCLPALVGLPPTIARVWRRFRPVLRGADRGPARSSAPSAAGSTAAPGCSSASRCCSRPSRVRKADAVAGAAARRCPRPSTAAGALTLARELSANYPDRVPGHGGRGRRCRAGSRSSSRRTGFSRSPSASAPTCPAAGRRRRQPGAHHPGRLTERDRRDGPPRRRRHSGPARTTTPRAPPR